MGCLLLVRLWGPLVPEVTADENPKPVVKTSDAGAVLPVSVEVRHDHTLVRLKATKKSKRRGVVMKGARLPVLSASQGPGCTGLWFEVHKDGWICEDKVQISQTIPWGLRYPVIHEGELTPWPYGFVHEPALEYRMKYGFLHEVREVLKGFGFGVQNTLTIDGIKYFRTAEGTLIPRGSAGITRRISNYQGIEIKEGKPWPVGWVNSKKAWAYSGPSRAKESRIGKVERYDTFEVLETSGKGRKKFWRFDSDTWLSDKDVRVTTDAPLPKGIAPGERWIDVDTSQQIATAYEGETPVYAALISSGRGGGSKTVKGEFRIWAKVSAIPMDNTDEQLEAEKDLELDTDEPPPEQHLYSLHDVPWTQFFFESYALHGVYWHDRFGNRRSHGCVNLAPTDAKWFYDWTAPHLPDGWWAIHSSEPNEGTLVRVR